jgi:hypothetical protein
MYIFSFAYICINKLWKEQECNKSNYLVIVTVGFQRHRQWEGKSGQNCGFCNSTVDSRIWPFGFHLSH